MKPKNDYQKRIVELSAKLPAITHQQRQWALDHCFNQDGYFSNGKVWCLHCGEVFEHSSSELGVTVLGDTVVCPKCGKKLKLEVCRKQKYEESWYYTILTTFHGFQVCRHFVVEKKIYRADKYPYSQQETFYSIQEAVQNWIDENGKETIVARPTKCIPHIYDAWAFDKPMAIRERRSALYSYTPDKYDIAAEYIYPHRNILPKIKKYGYSGRFKSFSHSELFKLLLTDREAEILAKNGQFDLLRYKWRQDIKEFCMPFAHSIRIANRNRYIVKDASMWYDYLDMLAYFHLDTHNAHYVCPADLKSEHDRLLERKKRIEEKAAIERKIAEAKKWESEYRKAKGKYFGICFGNEDIVITVISSVAEMAEEGEKMHHCVYSMGYYKKKNSLILSAKDRNGNLIETIELSLKTFQVVQSRGVCNSNTDKHNEILDLVQKNINLIKQAA